MVEQLICNQQVIGSNPIAGSLFKFLTTKDLRREQSPNTSAKPERSSLDVAFIFWQIIALAFPLIPHQQSVFFSTLILSGSNSVKIVRRKSPHVSSCLLICGETRGHSNLDHSSLSTPPAERERTGSTITLRDRSTITLATQQAIVAEIEAEQALVAANRDLITHFEQKIQLTRARI